MHVAMIIDEQRLSQEQSMLNRLCIGLTGEGVKVTRIVPESIGSESVQACEARMALLPRIEIPMKVPLWTRRARTQRIATALEDSLPDVVYAVGHMAQAIGIDLATALARPLAIEVWSVDQVRQIRRQRPHPSITAYVVPSDQIAEALRGCVEPHRVHVVPLGVAVAGTVHRGPWQSMHQPTIAVVGDAGDLPAYEAMLTGVSRIIKELPDLQVFLELRGAYEHDIWRVARNLELLPYISTLGDTSNHRTLLARCDLMLLPERSSEVRSLVLEAMALAVPIIASRENQFASLVSEPATVLVAALEPQAWADSIKRLLSDSAEAAAVGQLGRQIVIDRHGSSVQVSGLIRVMEASIGTQPQLTA